jgi:NADPH-dependent ferric siderophore reductase
MLSLDLDEFTFEIKEGAIKHVGPSNTEATAKLYDVEGVEAQEFGDKRVKLAFEDEDGNEVEVALFPAEAREVARGIELLEDDSQVFD